jgi:hypothetical protein
VKAGFQHSNGVGVSVVLELCFLPEAKNHPSLFENSIHSALQTAHSRAWPAELLQVKFAVHKLQERCFFSFEKIYFLSNILFHRHVKDFPVSALSAGKNLLCRSESQSLSKSAVSLPENLLPKWLAFLLGYPPSLLPFH